MNDTPAATTSKPVPKSTINGCESESFSHVALKHLFDRYHEFASEQPGRSAFSYPAIYAKIKKLFGAKWDMIHLDRFSDLCEFLQGRIDNTRLGRINRFKGHVNYSKFDLYTEKYTKPRNKKED